jgi:hypothetical protein
MQPDIVFGYRSVVSGLAELGRLNEAHPYVDALQTKFSGDMQAFLSIRFEEWREADYAAVVASLAKAGLALRKGKLTRAG